MPPLNIASLVHPLEITHHTTFLLQEIPCPHSPPHLFVYFCLFPHLDITSESAKGFRCEVLII